MPMTDTTQCPMTGKTFYLSLAEPQNHKLPVTLTKDIFSIDVLRAEQIQGWGKGQGR